MESCQKSLVLVGKVTFCKTLFRLLIDSPVMTVHRFYLATTDLATIDLYIDYIWPQQTTSLASTQNMALTCVFFCLNRLCLIM